MERDARPVGVVVLAVIHLLAGALVVSALAGFVLLQLVLTLGRSGIRLELLVGIAVAAFLGIGVGVGMLRGRAWSWHVVSLLYAVQAGTAASWFVLSRDGILPFRLPSAVQELEARMLLLAAIAPAGAGALAVALWLYVQARGVRRHCGIERWWPSFVTQLVLIGVIVAGAAWLDRARPAELVPSRAPFLQAIGQQGTAGEEDARFLLDYLESGNVEERASAAWSLGRIRPPAEGVAALRRSALEDPDASVRINAVISLAEVGGPGAADVLSDVLGQDDDEDVRVAALRGLAGEAHAGLFRRVASVLSDPSANLRGAAADTLGRMGRREAVDLLVPLAEDPEEDVRSRVAFALGRLGDRRAVPALTAMLEDERWEVRANAAQALGMIGDERARPALEKALRDSSSQVRATAEDAMSKLHGR